MALSVYIKTRQKKSTNKRLNAGNSRIWKNKNTTNQDLIDGQKNNNQKENNETEIKTTLHRITDLDPTN